MNWVTFRRGSALPVRKPAWNTTEALTERDPGLFSGVLTAAALSQDKCVHGDIVRSVVLARDPNCLGMDVLESFNQQLDGYRRRGVGLSAC